MMSYNTMPKPALIAKTISKSGSHINVNFIGDLQF